jgi:hypothetical protein
LPAFILLMEHLLTNLSTVGVVAQDVAAPDKADVLMPKLSVVVVALNPTAMLERCLAALAQQAATEAVEILVVGHRRPYDEHVTRLQQRFPQVQWMATPPQYTIPQQRSWGMGQSRGEIIALLEDDCVVNEDWCASILAAHQEAYVAIGGPIEPGDYKKGLDWAVFFCEYGRFMTPFAGPVSALPGNNVAYKKTALSSINHDEGFYDIFVHWQWQQQGEILFADPKLIVHNINAWSYMNTLRMAYHHGRAFAGMRVAGWPAWRKLLYASAVLFLPLLQVMRSVKNVRRRRRYARALVQALPWIGLFSASWAAGELLGYLCGAGGSVAQWRSMPV